MIRRTRGGATAAIVALACVSGCGPQPDAKEAQPAVEAAPASATPAAPAAPLKNVALHVNSASWVEGSSFPRDELDKLCAEAGIGFADRGELDVTIDYDEAKGSGYSRFGVGTPTAWGTNITYTITILSPGGSKTLLQRTGHDQTKDDDGGLHSNARSNFLKSREFTESCSAIAASLGSHGEAAKLLQWAVVQPGAGLKFLEQVKFEPATPGETAYMQVARQQFTDLSAAGADAGPPLKLFLSSFYDYDLGWTDTMGAGNAASLVAALKAYSATNHAEMDSVLTTLLERQCCAGHDRKAIQKAVLETVRDKGGRILLKPLADWREGVSQYAEDLRALLPLAEEARAAIVTRNPN